MGQQEDDGLSNRVVIILVTLIVLMVFGGPSLESWQTPTRDFSQGDDWPETCAGKRSLLLLADDAVKARTHRPNVYKDIHNVFDEAPWCFTQAEVNTYTHVYHQIWGELLISQARACAGNMKEMDPEWVTFDPTSEVVGRTFHYKTLSQKEKGKLQYLFRSYALACGDTAADLLEAMNLATERQAQPVELRNIVRRFYTHYYQGDLPKDDPLVGTFEQRYPLTQFMRGGDFAAYYLQLPANTGSPLPHWFVEDVGMSLAEQTVIVKAHWSDQGGPEAQFAMARRYIEAGYDEEQMCRGIIRWLAQQHYHKSAKEAADECKMPDQRTWVLRDRYATAMAQEDVVTVLDRWGNSSQRVVLRDKHD